MEQLIKIQKMQKNNIADIEYFAPIDQMIEDYQGFYLVYEVQENKSVVPLTEFNNLIKDSNKELENKDIASIAKQLLKAIQIMSKNAIILKNLKPANIFMNDMDLIV